MRVPARLLTSAAVVSVLLTVGLTSVPAAHGDAAPGWEWPLSPAIVERRFEAPVQPYGPGHRGVDLAPRGSGREIVAPADGVVAFVGRVVDRDVLTIDHGGLVSSFEPVASGLTAGAPVRRGQPVATLALGGHAAAGRLHFGVRRDGDYIDPLSLLREPRRAVLLPCC